MKKEQRVEIVVPGTEYYDMLEKEDKLAHGDDEPSHRHGRVIAKRSQSWLPEQEE